MKKYLIWLGHLSLLVTAILAVFFYKERVFFVDPGQQLFEMINEGGFKVFVHRYSMVINQSIPLLAIKLGLPLKYITIAYSLSFVIIFYICYLIAVYGFKNIAAGLGIAFAPIFIRMAFGHSISEAWLGIAYSAVFYALLNYYHVWKKKGPVFIALFYFLMIVVIGINYFIHPITLFTVAFSIGFTYFYKKEFRSSHIYIVGMLILVVYLHKFAFPAHPHEERFFEGIKNADKLLPQLGQLPVLEFFRLYFYQIYLPGILLLVGAIFYFIKDRRIISYFFVIIFSAFYVVIACLAFYKGDAPFALESRLIPLAFMLILPVAEILKEKKENILFISGLVVILFYSYTNLYSLVKQTHTKRIAFYEHMLSESMKFPERKFFVYLPEGENTPVNTWGSAVETLMLSSLEGKENSRTIIFVDRKTDITSGINFWPCVFLWVRWYMFFPEDWLNKRYYNLQCTKYRELIYPKTFD